MAREKVGVSWNIYQLSRNVEVVPWELALLAVCAIRTGVREIAAGLMNWRRRTHVSTLNVIRQDGPQRQNVTLRVTAANGQEQPKTFLLMKNVLDGKNESQVRSTDFFNLNSIR